MARELLYAQSNVSQVWVADVGNGTYKNPIIHADYSDPDAIRVGDDFYMISSSFNHVPGLPVLHSKDLVNWQLITHVLTVQQPVDHFDKVQHGGGVWAPSIRYHNGLFYIYFPDPDFGIYLTTAKDIKGPWSKPILVEAGKGLIDPCPLWDDDGKMYLVHAYAGSRAGIKSILVIKQLNNTGTAVSDNGVLVYDGHDMDPTIEGPKIYKRNNYYYIFAPAGGVSTGWQTVLRSKSIYGPYERKVVMTQGSSNINGPHQGAWIRTQKGEDWFIHFQDKGAYGRVVHLQPLKWWNDWPIIGEDQDGDGIGQPVLVHTKPLFSQNFSMVTIADTDEFNANQLGLQWQWQANPKPYWAFLNQGNLRLYAYPILEQTINYWDVPNLLLQKFPAEKFMASTKITFKPRLMGEKAGLIVHGTNYAYLALVNEGDSIVLMYSQCKQADRGTADQPTVIKKLIGSTFYLCAKIDQDAVVSFGYSHNGKDFVFLEDKLTAKPGKWVGAKIGLFCTGKVKTNDAGFADVDWFRIASQ